MITLAYLGMWFSFLTPVSILILGRIQNYRNIDRILKAMLGTFGNIKTEDEVHYITVNCYTCEKCDVYYFLNPFILPHNDNFETY